MLEKNRGKSPEVADTESQGSRTRDAEKRKRSECEVFDHDRLTEAEVEPAREVAQIYATHAVQVRRLVQSAPSPEKT